MAEVSDVKVDIEMLCTGVVHGTGLARAALCFSGAPFAPHATSAILYG